jgi:hypothetical protein
VKKPIFDFNNGTVIVASNTIVINPNPMAIPPIKTKSDEKIKSSYAYLIFGKNINDNSSYRYRYGYQLNYQRLSYDIIRIFPQFSIKEPTKYIIVNKNSPLIFSPKLVFYEHDDFTIISNVALEIKMCKNAINNSQFDLLLTKLFLLLKDITLENFIDDDTFEALTKKFEKVKNVLARSTSIYEGEANVSKKLTINLSNSLIDEIIKVIK